MTAVSLLKRRYTPPGTDIGARLDKYSEPDMNGGCWIWSGALSSPGYGKLTVNGKALGAHRLAWERANGPVPAGMCVCHTCDVRACVNPDHLFLGTHADNAADRSVKGRSRGQAVGEGHSLTKLSNADVLSVLVRLDAGEGCVSLGKKYGVSHSTISNIKNGVRWQHVTGLTRSAAA